MKALVYHGPHQLKVEDIPVVEPGNGEVLLKIKACGICGSDVHGYEGKTGRRIPPMVMGHEFSAVVEKCGEGVSSYKVGDRVIVQPVRSCGHCTFCGQGLNQLCPEKTLFGVMTVNGAFAEYLTVPEKSLYPLPEGMDFGTGALIEAFAVAYRGVTKAGGIAGKTVYIVGAGTIGMLALCIAKQMGPKQVIVSDVSDFRLETAKKLGADITVNAATQDVVEVVSKSTGGDMADAVIECVGVQATVTQGLQVLKITGTCVWVGLSAKTVEIDMQAVVGKEFKIFGTYTYTHEQFGEAIQFLAEKKIDLSAVITDTITIEEAPDMFRELAENPANHLKAVVQFQ